MRKIIALLIFAYSFTTIINAQSLGRIGNPTDTITKTSAGYLLMGGSTDVDEAIQWFLQKSGGGDIVILRASGSTGYNSYMYELSKVNSVESLLINSKELAMLPELAQKIRNAEGIFIAGGDQWNYVNFWSNTPIQAALQYVITVKKIPVGGTSAGLAVLGEYAFDAKLDGITTDEALADLQSPKISITHEFLTIPILKNIITDSHYSQRNRMGRHIAFMAAIQQKENIPTRGIGIDEKTALVLEDDGSGIAFGSNTIYFLQLISAKKEASISPEVSIQKVTASKLGTPIHKLNDYFKKGSMRVKISNKQLITN